MRKLIHGECILTEVEHLPINSKKIKTKGDSFIIGDSETIGNYHKVSLSSSVEIFDNKETLFIKNEKKTNIFCPDTTRHDSIELPEGIWELGIANEFDYLSDKERKVID